MLLFFYFAVGLCVGSFINVVNYRLPLMMGCADDHADAGRPGRPLDLIYPRSHCVTCKKKLGVMQLVPVLSWLFQSGRCHFCKKPISVKYPLVELISGGLVSGIYYCYHDPVTVIPLCILSLSLLSLVCIDIEHMLLPDAITLPLMWGGLLLSSSGFGLITMDDAVWGAVLGYLSLWFANFLYFCRFKHNGIGHGDFKLMAALGAWIGKGGVNGILMIAPIMGFIFWAIFYRKKVTRKMPFGPALIVSAMCYVVLEMDNFYLVNIPFVAFVLDFGHVLNPVVTR